jgi:hypothetical protein
MAGVSKQTAGWLMVGGIVVGVGAGRWWERTHHVAAQATKAEIHATNPPVAAVHRNEPLPPPDMAVVEMAERQLVSLFETASLTEREVEVRRVLSRITASELRELGSRIIASMSLASLGRPDQSLEEFLFERLGAEFGAGFETFLKTIPLATTAALDGWIGADAAGALEHFKHRPLDGMAGLLAARLAEVWLEKDAGGFAAYMRGLPRVYEGMPVKKQLVAVWSKHDPKAAFDWAWQHLDSEHPEYASLVAEAFHVWANHNLGEAISALHSMPDLKERIQLPEAIVRSLDSDEKNRAMRELLKLPIGPLDGIFLPGEDRSWAVDPSVFLRLFIRAGETRPMSGHYLGEALARLAKEDPAQAVALYHEIPAEKKGQLGMIAPRLVVGLAGSDLEACIRFMRQDLSPAGLELALPNVMSAAARKDPIAALQLLDLAQEGWKASLWNLWGTAVADSDPEKLKSYLAFMPTGSASPMLVGTAVAKMATTDMAGAGEWAASLPPGAARLEAYRVLSAQLTIANPKQTEQWLQTMPDIPERTAAITEFVRKTTYKDTELAVRWALALPDIETNPEPFERAAKYWLQQQRDKATEYFRTHEVPEALRPMVQPKTK